MRISTRVFWVFFGFFFFLSNFLQASSYSLSPEFGVVKSKNGEIFLSCSEESSHSKKCYLYLVKKAEEPEAITRELTLLKLTDGSKSLFSMIDEGHKEEISSTSYMPLTTVALGLMMAKGEKFIPMFLLSTLDLVAGPLGLMADGFYRLYKVIQGTYLKRAWKVLIGLKKKKSMHLTRKDFKELVEVIKRKSL